ncbi:MAG TPA: SrfA family protein [Vineibacter sp.]|nr:SrfA family protein [Vineibacter sp.]
MPGTTLVRTTLTGVRPLGVRGEPLHHAQAQIRAVVRRRLSDRAFNLLAEPQPHDLGGRIDWYSELTGPVRPLPDLPTAERDAARADIDALLAEIDQAGQALEAGPTDDGRLAGRSLRLAAKRPSDDYLFLVGDQPVVVCWGYDTEAAGAVLPGAFLPSATTVAPPPPPPPVLAPAAPLAIGPASAAALAPTRVPWLFWLLAGLVAIALLLLASWLLRHFMPAPPDLRVTELAPPPAPPPDPPLPDPTVVLKGDLDGARDEEGRLKVTLASLRDELEGRVRQCRPPEPPKPPEPPVVERKPEPKPEPKPKVAERKPEPPPKPPDDRMRMPTAPTNDYSFLQGCWRTDSFKHGPRIPPGYATYCFDGNGRGSMVFRFDDGTTCRAPATARFAGGTLRVVDADSTCSPQGQWAQDRLDCTAGAGGVAYCRGENRTERWTVNLHRVGG